jgi:ribonucleotide monophosphatase NagD (HAD superfamily)
MRPNLAQRSRESLIASVCKRTRCGSLVFTRISKSKSQQGELFGSAYASAVYISTVLRLPKDKKVYVIGQSGLEQELRDEGISFVGGTVSAEFR